MNLDQISVEHFLFWDYFKTNKEELKKECIGILDL